MTDQAENYIHTLISLEPAFIEAANLARDLQATVKSYNKGTTGNTAIDIVSEADFLVEETAVTHLLKTDLVHCRMYAEEASALTDAFAKESQYYLTMDPIDGTRRYVDGRDVYSFIIQLHTLERPIYSYLYYPNFNWWVRMVHDTIERSGPAPISFADRDLSKTIVKNDGDPSQMIPELYQALTDQEIAFLRSAQIELFIGAKYLFLNAELAGYYSENPNLYDGSVAYHYALTQGFTMAHDTISGQRLTTDARGVVYDGTVLILNPRLVKIPGI